MESFLRSAVYALTSKAVHRNKSSDLSEEQKQVPKPTRGESNSGGDGGEPAKKSPQLIGYRGNWYDVRTFIPKHPGGDIIKKFIDQDATSVIDSMHRKDVMKYLKPCEFCFVVLGSLVPFF